MKKTNTKAAQASATLANIHAILPELEGADLEALRNDMKEKGQLVPILSVNGRVVDGRARLRICQEEGIEPVMHELGEAANDADWAISTNLYRRHLTTGQRALIAAELANLTKGSNQHTASAACSRKDAAKRMDVSEDSIDRAKRVKELGCDRLINMVKKGSVSLDSAAKLVKSFPDHIVQEEVIAKGTERVKKDQYKKLVLDTKRAAAKKLAANNGAALETLRGTYSVIYADPPWDYGGNNEGSYCDPSVHYPLMSTEAIKALPVKECLDVDAALYLWVPNTLIPEGMEVLKAWGFAYVSCMVWCKNKPVMSLGPTKTAHETLLIGRKGKALHDTKQRRNSWIEADVTTHSKKPEVFAEMLDAMYPEFPKLEMFARQPRGKYWSVFGNQVVSENGGITKGDKALIEQPIPTAKTRKPTKQLATTTAKIREELFAANDPRSKLVA